MGARLEVRVLGADQPRSQGICPFWKREEALGTRLGADQKERGLWGPGTRLIGQMTFLGLRSVSLLLI